MILKFIVSTSFFIGLLSSTNTRAYDPCEPDIEKLCMHNFHSKSNKECLHENLKDLSKDCKALVISKKDEWKERLASLEEVKKNCSKERKSMCAEIKEGQKELLVCIMTNSQSISDSCKKRTNQHIKDWLPSIKAMK